MVFKAIEKLTNLMANGINRFITWLADKRNFLVSRYTKDVQETQEPEKSLAELPLEMRSKLVSAVENLPSNPADKQAIASTLDEAYEFWRNDPKNANNSLVILSSPITAVSRILSETLEEWAKQKQTPLRLLPFKALPKNLNSIKSKLEHYLQENFSESEDTDSLEIVVIPNLSWCFLRSFEGLEGIEYLQSLLCDRTQNRFWIIGSGQVSWQYLNSVCALEAYCGKIFTLPTLTSEELESWFQPIIDELDIVFEKSRIDQQILDSEQSNQTSYFQRLANVSQGISTVAVQAFFKSIGFKKVDEKEQQDSATPELKRLVAQTPKLPKLPNLKSADRYLLYSLLLHGDLTIPSLAESLGDSESEIQTMVQLLRREGVVEQRNNLLKINPIYYPRIKQELASNNFIINRG